MSPAHQSASHEIEDRLREWSRNPAILWHGSKGTQMADHALAHTQNLLGILDNLLELTASRGHAIFRASELRTLRLAIWLHDIGHRGSRRYQEPIDVRDYHGVMSGLALLDDAARSGGRLYKLTLQDALSVALVSMYHQRATPFNRNDRKKPPFPAKEIEPGTDESKEWLVGLLRVPTGVIPDSRHDSPLLLREVAIIVSFSQRLGGLNQAPRPWARRLERLCAFLRFLDSLDYRFNRVGSQAEVVSRTYSLEREREYSEDKVKEYVKKLKKLAEKKGHQAPTIPRKSLEGLLRLYRDWKARSDMSLRALDVRLKSLKDVTISNLNAADPASASSAGEYIGNWAWSLRYAAFLRDQKNRYYPIHRSVDNVYFRGAKLPGAMELVVDINPRDPRRMNLATCRKTIMENIRGEWQSGCAGNGDKGVGELIRDEGVQITRYVFRNVGSRPVRETSYPFP